MYLLLEFVEQLLVRPVRTWLALSEASSSGYATRNLLNFPQSKQISLGMTVEQDAHSSLGSTQGAMMWDVGDNCWCVYIVVEFALRYRVVCSLCGIFGVIELLSFV